jgi:hypothetical protein
MKYAVEMGSGAVRVIKIGSAIQKLTGEIRVYRHTDGMVKA